MKRAVNILQDFGKSLFAPVLILPIVGLFIAFGNMFGNGNLATYVPFLSNPYIQGFGQLLSGSAVAILVNLALVFAVGIPIGLAKKDKGYAALTGLVTFIIFMNAMNLTLSLTGNLADPDTMRAAGQGMVLGVQVLEMGVFAGILIGGLVGYLHNKYSSVQFEGVMAIYSGHRFVVILAIPTAIALGFAMTFVWPYAQSAITSSALFIKSAGGFGVFLYGFLERVLIPTGLHHLVYTPFLYTELGGTAEVCGQMYNGARNIYFAEMACQDVTQLSTTAVWDARGIAKMFGLTAAALAMYVTASPSKKNAAKAILFPAALTSFLLGVTEPIEFAFLFTAPVLFVVHAVLTGVGMTLYYLLDVHAIGANGAIDFVLYNLPLGLEKSNWHMYILVGLIMSVLYFLVFRTLILKLDLKTPGRGDEAEEVKLYDKKDYQAKQTDEVAATEIGVGHVIIDGLGGRDNIDTVDNCYTRLRVTVKDTSKIDEPTLLSTGAKGVIKSGDNIQVVYGLHVKKMRDAVEDVL
ncbi:MULTISPECIES: PTS transporter subunit EIIC [unclassified Exiguobacterium]|uniref:PTS transporter subunit EIIC n=1 Tax=Exiguobacterium sp. IPCH1 TaxID=2510947 RepID=UPI00103E6561|nr:MULTISPECIES: PTS transporter subunit EIIC [unclassified Exiguobacterium]TCI67197.1 PTS glucose transporter subunit IIBC [Exiguobacterium sp. IPCI3]TCI76655.1 PTS glucose transporter subunit IIBC [Exiguobacterium sp. IPCH1]TCI78306.1 PTS glucose transporter subunit IIBC [Exiguobacterium sp. IPBC4]